MTAALPFELESNETLPDTVLGYISIRSQGGVSEISLTSIDLRQHVPTEPFRGSATDVSVARRAIEDCGLRIIADSRLGFAVSGEPRMYEQLTNGRVVARERLLHAEAGRERYVTHLDIVGPGQPEAVGVAVARTEAAAVEAVLLERPRIPAGLFPSPVPPSVPKYHLRVPDDVALGLGASAAHRAGYFGANVVVAMVDSGQYPHPFFAAHAYNVRPTVAVVPNTNPTKDPVGHGTGESANIFAVAPGAELRPYRVSNNSGQLVGAISGFMTAKAALPRILTNSWGGDGPYPPLGPLESWDAAWALEILDGVEQGIFVVFAAGNGQFSVEPQVPGVFAAGGTYMEADTDLIASNYASGYVSPESWFPGIQVPDACGLVGLRPRAQYLMLPVPPNCEIDRMESQAASGDTPDGTSSNDGWALFSGTSAAAPQIAGVAALILGAQPGLTPAQVTECINATARDVTWGSCHPRFNHPALLGRDLATGFGLVNASAAVQYALDHFP